MNIPLITITQQEYRTLCTHLFDARRQAAALDEENTDLKARLAVIQAVVSDCELCYA